MTQSMALSGKKISSYRNSVLGNLLYSGARGQTRTDLMSSQMGPVLGEVRVGSHLAVPAPTFTPVPRHPGVFCAGYKGEESA